MSKRKKTYVAIVLDQSSSMENTKAEAVMNYNEQIQQAKIYSKDQDIFVCLVTFNGEVFEHLWLEPASKLQEASVKDYETNGSTAMHDAIGYTINKLMHTTDTKEEDIAYLINVISDGDENSSCPTKYKDPRKLKSLIDEVQNMKNSKGDAFWTISYMGCDEKYLEKLARETNIPIQNMAAWCNKSRGLARKGLEAAALKLNDYYDARTKGATALKSFYSDEVGVCANFTETSGGVVQNDAAILDQSPAAFFAVEDNVVGDSEGKAFCNKKAVTWNV